MASTLHTSRTPIMPAPQRSTVRFACLVTLTGVIASAMPALGGPPAPPELECPPDAMDEREPCGEDTNGGCNTDREEFDSVLCGQTVCGNAWADGAVRDTDWFMQFPANAPELTLTLTVTTTFPLVVYAKIDGGFKCAALPVYDMVEVPAGETGSLTLSSTWDPGEVGIWIIAPQVFDGIPCEGGEPFGNEYVATWSCAVIPCPDVGDANGDAFVDFNDLLVVLANFGPCP